MSQDVALAALRSKIAAVLPSHMRSLQWMALTGLPTASNYKADRRRLSGPGNFPGKDQDFLTIGGNSILAIKAARELFHFHTATGTRSAISTVIRFTFTGVIDTEALAESFKVVQRENSIMRARW
ncbi:amino acid adenylation domain-containing protein [Colletotrichum graminicola M1.001]|uniref:Amino acid adenylation domain-containing protein n=1 Tax=Colletotrichum graminicola (strain M1.001 / M2 / FGSC 10212) TaxID=645133 RepID=E3Q4M7_COLGM|nr:amino acid adenylation domain-containing protein [Colletotrichum graminicola M1.001]EFQ26042.1 amino acid adenylation domain-containing protein [Colletotrichum graminicola M1.001]